MAHMLLCVWVKIEIEVIQTKAKLTWDNLKVFKVTLDYLNTKLLDYRSQRIIQSNLLKLMKFPTRSHRTGKEIMIRTFQIIKLQLKFYQLKILELLEKLRMFQSKMLSIVKCSQMIQTFGKRKNKTFTNILTKLMTTRETTRNWESDTQVTLSQINKSIKTVLKGRWVIQFLVN